VKSIRLVFALMLSIAKSLVAACVFLMLAETGSIEAATQGFMEGHLKIASVVQVGPPDEMLRPGIVPESYAEYPLIEQSVWSKGPDVQALLNSYAGMLGLNIDRFRKDMESEQAKGRIKSHEQQALALGLAMTPSIFVNNGKLSRAKVNPPGLRIAIDSAMKKASK
jgi:hypothetical protein